MVKKNTVYFPRKTKYGYEVDFEQNCKIVRTEIFAIKEKALQFYNEQK